MKIVVAGGSGFIGKAVVSRLLNEQHSVVLLTRDPGNIIQSHPKLQIELWDAQTNGEWVRQFESSQAVINLAGALIAGKRWTPSQKGKILNSRLSATNNLVTAMRRLQNKPSVLVSVSAVGYYGNVPAGDVPELSPNGDDFLADVCRRWEEAALGAQQIGVRVVIPRLGVVLARDGGALQRLMLPFKMYAGGYLGSGSQWFPWVHRDDVVNAILFAVQHPDLSGPVNVTAPDFVTMKTFCSVLGKVMHSPSWTFVPAFVLRIMLGEMAEMLLTGQKAVPQRLLESGFQFSRPSLQSALDQILHPHPKELMLRDRV